MCLSSCLSHQSAVREGLGGYLALEPFRRWWVGGREILRAEFVEYVERQILPTAEGTRLHWDLADPADEA